VPSPLECFPVEVVSEPNQIALAFGSAASCISDQEVGSGQVIARRVLAPIGKRLQEGIPIPSSACRVSQPAEIRPQGRPLFLRDTGREDLEGNPGSADGDPQLVNRLGIFLASMDREGQIL
jgi:hypothetical protein